MYLEADVLYSYLKPDDWLKADAERILNKKTKFTTSVVTAIEIEIVSQRDFDPEFSLSVLSRLKHLKNLEIIPLESAILEKSIQIRRKHNLTIFDSIHAANCLAKNLEMISTDPIFDKVLGLKRIDPRSLK